MKSSFLRYSVLTSLVMVLTAMNQTMQAQTRYRFFAPDSVLQKNGRLFRVIADDTLNIIDSNNFVLHQFIRNQPVASYRYQLKRKGRRIEVSKTESLYHDSLIADSFNRGLLYQTPVRLKILTPGISSLQQTEPVYAEVVYQTPSAPADTINKTANPKKEKEPFFSVHGKITVIGQVSDNRFQGQSYPEQFVRTYVNTNVNIGGLPINMDYVYSTESNSGMNKINNIRFSFDYQTFYSNLRKKIDQGVAYDKSKKLEGLTDINIAEIDKEFSGLNSKLKSGSYQRQLEKYKKIQLEGEQDSSFKKSFRYKRSVAFMSKYDQDSKRLKELEQLKQEYLRYRRMADTYAGMKELDLNKPAGFKKAAVKYGYNKPGLGFMLSLRKFDLGTFDPDYTKLVLGGVSLTGVNTEINAGIFYGAFTWGAALNNFDNPFSLNVAGSRTITHGRIGIGRKEKMLLAFSILKGKDGSGNFINDSSGSFYIPSNNYVIGADYTYQINDRSVVGLEYARTIIEPTPRGTEALSTSTQLNRLIRVDQAQFTNAWNARAETVLPETNTKLKGQLRIVDPFYYSFGTPYLRRDNFRTEASAEQPFLSNQLTLGLSYRFDRDNLYDLKEGTSKNHTLFFKAHIKKKKYPFVILIYSPSFQSFYSHALRKGFYSRTDLYSVITGYTRNKKNTQTTYTGSYHKQLNSSNEKEITLYHIDMVSYSTIHLIKPMALALSGTLTYIHPWSGGDSSKSVGLDTEISKGLFKQKVTVKGGYGFQRDVATQTRHIIKAGTQVSLKYGIGMELALERHFIIYARATDKGKNTDMHLGRLTIIKTF